MEKRYFLITAFGKDRPGIVAGITCALFEAGGNVEDASMTRLGGEFTIMMISALPAGASVKNLERKLAALGKKLDVQSSLKTIPPGLARKAHHLQPRYMISVYGNDRPGIVYQVAQALAQHKVSITDLQTKVLSSRRPPVYVMLLEVQVPPTVDMDGVREALDQLRQSLRVEITLQDIEAVSL